MKRIVWTLLFSAIFLLGLALRSPELLSGNYLFGFDQGQNYMRAYDIAVNHKFTLIGAEVGSGSAGVPGLFHGPGFYYVLAIALFLFRGDPYGGVVFMWAGGVLTMLIVFLTTRRMFGEKTSLISLFLVAVAPLIAPQSRFVWGPHLASVLIAAYLYALYNIPDRPVLWIFVATLLAGMMYNFELALSVPLTILVLISLIIWRTWSTKSVASFILAAVIAFSPMLLFEARHGFMAVGGIVSNIMRQKPAAIEEGKPISRDPFEISQKRQQFVSNFRDSFVFEFGMVPPEWYTRFLGVLAVIMIVGIASSRDVRAKKYFAVLGLSIPVTVLVFLPLRGSIWPYYLTHLHFVYIYALAYSAFTVLSGVLHPGKSVFANAAKIGASLIVLFFFLSMTRGALKRVEINWMIDYSDYGGKDKIAGKRAIIDYVYADAQGKPFSVFVFMPPVYTWPYDYLFLTYAKEKYGYTPGSEKKGTAYMIIELDGEKPWSYKGWLETVIRQGTPVWERAVTGPDHLVQKRIFD